MDSGRDGHCDPPCVLLGGPSAALDLCACGVERWAHRKYEGRPCSLHMQGTESTGLCWQLITYSISMTPITMASKSLAAPG